MTIETYDLDENGNIILFLLDRETIVKVNVIRSTNPGFRSEVCLLCLCGNIDSMSLFGKLFFDLYNCIDFHCDV